jgi:predicted Mrr-cat superfamily restriction endonuclease
MNYWIHRISRHERRASYPLLEKGFLSIGFIEFADEELLNNSTKGDKEFFESAFKKDPSRGRWSLWYFLHDMNKGDWVIVPSEGVCSIYEVLERGAILPPHVEIENLCDLDENKIEHGGERQFFVDSKGDEIDIGFVRQVRLIHKDISRYDFADSYLTQRLKTRWTTSNISDLEDNIKSSIKRFENNERINLKNCIFEISVDKWQNTIQSELNPNKFEKLVCGYFRQIGCTNVCKSSQNYADKNGDVDVIATFEQIRTIINVQVKFHEGMTDEWAVEQINDFAESKIDLDDGYFRQYWVISSSDSFSKKAENLAKEKGVLLINGKEFVKMLILSGIEKIDEFC